MKYSEHYQLFEIVISTTRVQYTLIEVLCRYVAKIPAITKYCIYSKNSRLQDFDKTSFKIEF